MAEKNHKRQFGDYQIKKKIAEGEFAEIFLVEKDNKPYALKKLKPYLKYDDEYVQTLKTEGEVLSRVSDFDHFPKLYEVGTFEEEFFLILDLIEGLSLEKIIKGTEEIPIPFACRIAIETCKALEHLHAIDSSSGGPMVHADLRPSNVMVTTDGEVKLIDLGLKGGTFIYMPLKRLHDREVDPHTDIYATGHILFELLHRKHLFKGRDKMETYFEMRERRITEETFHPSLPRQLRKILKKILDQECEETYFTPTELQKDLSLLLETQKDKTSKIELGDWIKEIQGIKSR